VQIADRIKVDGHAGTVVALLHERVFASEYPASVWDYLETGILVVDDEAGLIHYPDLSGLRVEHLNG
jgi:hypothetical protein